MLGIEMLEKYPLSAKVIKEWLMEIMLESFKDETVPEDFKEMLKEQGIENDKVSSLINSNPRFLFDIFDKYDIIIETTIYSNKDLTKEFSIKIGNQATTRSWKTRKESDLWAIEAAFDILENKLKQ